MKTIYKYSLPIEDEFSLMLPDCADILSFQVDVKDNKPVIWAKIDTDQPIVERFFTIEGTGTPSNFDDKEYIGTIQRGYYVWHLFELKPQPPKED